MSNVRHLAAALKAVEDDNEIVGIEEQEEYHALIKTALKLADDVLITNAGTPDWDAITELRAHGYDVQPGEKDSFGWLTGVISTKKGKLVFG